eukprot:TRINITY_DN6794_c0_g1_i28.p1 TRINITY_DN6794_c0_g1~~TRINITY_DN6794_c0_g1_i28.p1  ORF type:complete len:1458 (-),score=328.45 TRINITY_DN6794_c0_g1_i28:66-4355(-)
MSFHADSITSMGRIDEITITKGHKAKIEEVKAFLTNNDFQGPMWPDEDIFNLLRTVKPAFHVYMVGSHILDASTHPQQWEVAKGRRKRPADTAPVIDRPPTGNGTNKSDGKRCTTSVRTKSPPARVPVQVDCTNDNKPQRESDSVEKHNSGSLAPETFPKPPQTKTAEETTNTGSVPKDVTVSPKDETKPVNDLWAQKVKGNNVPTRPKTIDHTKVFSGLIGTPQAYVPGANYPHQGHGYNQIYNRGPGQIQAGQVQNQGYNQGYNLGYNYQGSNLGFKQRQFSQQRNYGQSGIQLGVQGDQGLNQGGNRDLTGHTSQKVNQVPLKGIQVTNQGISQQQINQTKNLQGQASPTNQQAHHPRSQQKVKQLLSNASRSLPGQEKPAPLQVPQQPHQQGFQRGPQHFPPSIPQHLQQPYHLVSQSGNQGNTHQVTRSRTFQGQGLVPGNVSQANEPRGFHGQANRQGVGQQGYQHSRQYQKGPQVNQHGLFNSQEISKSSFQLEPPQNQPRQELKPTHTKASHWKLAEDSRNQPHREHQKDNQQECQGEHQKELQDEHQKEDQSEDQKYQQESKNELKNESEKVLQHESQGEPELPQEHQTQTQTGPQLQTPTNPLISLTSQFQSQQPPTEVPQHSLHETTPELVEVGSESKIEPKSEEDETTRETEHEPERNLRSKPDEEIETQNQNQSPTQPSSQLQIQPQGQPQMELHFQFLNPETPNQGCSDENSRLQSEGREIPLKVTTNQNHGIAGGNTLGSGSKNPHRVSKNQLDDDSTEKAKESAKQGPHRTHEQFTSHGRGSGGGWGKKWNQTKWKLKVEVGTTAPPPVEVGTTTLPLVEDGTVPTEGDTTSLSLTESSTAEVSTTTILSTKVGTTVLPTVQAGGGEVEQESDDWVEVDDVVDKVTPATEEGVNVSIEEDLNCVQLREMSVPTQASPLPILSLPPSLHEHAASSNEISPSPFHENDGSGTALPSPKYGSQMAESGQAVNSSTPRLEQEDLQQQEETDGCEEPRETNLEDRHKQTPEQQLYQKHDESFAAPIAFSYPIGINPRGFVSYFMPHVGMQSMGISPMGPIPLSIGGPIISVGPISPTGPMGPPMGPHIGSMASPMGPPLGPPLTPTMGPPMGTPMGSPMGPPMGSSIGPPMGSPMVPPMGMSQMRHVGGHIPIPTHINQAYLGSGNYENPIQAYYDPHYPVGYGWGIYSPYVLQNPYEVEDDLSGVGGGGGGGGVVSVEDCAELDPQDPASHSFILRYEPLDRDQLAWMRQDDGQQEHPGAALGGMDQVSGLPSQWGVPYGVYSYPTQYPPPFVPSHMMGGVTAHHPVPTGQPLKHHLIGNQILQGQNFYGTLNEPKLEHLEHSPGISPHPYLPAHGFGYPGSVHHHGLTPEGDFYQSQQRHVGLNHANLHPTLSQQQHQMPHHYQHHHLQHHSHHQL